MAKNPTNIAARKVLECSLLALRSIDSMLLGSIVKTSNAIAGRSGKIVTLGVGKSGLIAQKVASTLTSLGVSSVSIHPTDALHGDLGVVSPVDTVLAFSHSGNTRELLSVLRHVVKIGPLLVGICGDSSSRLAQISEHALVYRLAGEGSPQDLAPMASTTACLVIGDMLAAEVAVRRGFNRQKFAQLHPSGSLGLQFAFVSDIMLSGAQIPAIGLKEKFHNGLIEMTSKSMGVVAVLDVKHRIVGVLTDGDVRRFILSGKYSPSSMVSDAMTSSPKTMVISATLYDALQIMEKHRITSLFIVDKSRKLKGLLHLHQIVERQMT